MATTMYTIQFDGDGGSPVPPSTTINLLDDHDSYSYTIPNIIPSRGADERFIYWSYWDERGDMNERTASPGNIINITKKMFPVNVDTLVFTAEWKDIDYETEHIISIQFSSDGTVSNMPTNIIDTIQEPFNPYIFHIPAQEPIRAGYIFKGWGYRGGIYKYPEHIAMDVYEDIVINLEASWELASFTIITQPQTQTITRPNQMATFQVDATGNNLSYQWQYFLSATSSWMPLTDNDTSLRCLVNGATTKELSFSKFRFGSHSMPIGNGTLPIRCLITSNNMDTLSTQEVNLILNLPTTYIKTENGWKVAALFTKTNAGWKWGTALPKTSQGWE